MNASLNFRLATMEDVPVIVQMLLDDVLGATRETIGDNISEKYMAAFKRIEADPNQELTVAEMNGEIVATFQLTFIQYLAYPGRIACTNRSSKNTCKILRTGHRHTGVCLRHQQGKRKRLLYGTTYFR